MTIICICVIGWINKIHTIPVFFLAIMDTCMFIFDTIGKFIMRMCNVVMMMMAMFIFPRDFLIITDYGAMIVLKRVRMTVRIDVNHATCDENKNCWCEKLCTEALKFYLVKDKFHQYLLHQFNFHKSHSLWISFFLCSIKFTDRSEVRMDSARFIGQRSDFI